MSNHLRSRRTRLAVRGGEKAVTQPPPRWPRSGAWEARMMANVVRSGRWSWLGPHERAFCEEFSAFIGSRYALALANGTVTLQCALQAVGVEPGDEVIVPGMTWVATAQAAIDIGANVVFADVDLETLTLDPAAFERAITGKTRAVIPVHLYGCMCDMDALCSIARKRGIKVVEDAAHQHGSCWKGKGAGALGDAGSFSFQQSKVLTSGEGGAVTTNDPEIYRTVFALKQVGWAPTDLKKSLYEPLEPANRYGHNYRMTEMQAVLLRGGLKRLEGETLRREKRAVQLREGLEAIGGPLRVARRDPRITRQAYYGLTLVYDSSCAGGVSKQAFAYALTAEGCPVGNPYWPVYRSPLLNLYDRTSPIPYRDPEAVQDYRNLRLPHTERAFNDTALVLGHVHLLGSESYIRQLLDAVRKVSDHLSEVQAAWDAQQRKAR